jgi:CRP-like cAMP-binding protein
MPQAFDPASLHLEAASEEARLLAQFPDLLPLSFGDGEHLIREDATSREIYLVLRGAVVVEKASAAPGGTPVVLACLTVDPDSPAIIGEMAYLGDQPRAASVRSSGRTHALCLKPSHIDAILDGYPGLTRVICQQFSRRLQDTDQALRTLQSRFALAPTRRLAQPGEMLFSQGDPADALFQLVTGSVRLEGLEGLRILTPTELPQGFLEAGPYLAGGTHRATATVADTAFLAVIDQDHRQAWIRTFPEVVLASLPTWTSWA